MLVFLRCWVLKSGWFLLSCAYLVVSRAIRLYMSSEKNSSNSSVGVFSDNFSISSRCISWIRLDWSEGNRVFRNFLSPFWFSRFKLFVAHCTCCSTCLELRGSLDVTRPPCLQRARFAGGGLTWIWGATSDSITQSNTGRIIALQTFHKVQKLDSPIRDSVKLDSAIRDSAKWDSAIREDTSLNYYVISPGHNTKNSIYL